MPVLTGQDLLRSKILDRRKGVGRGLMSTHLQQHIEGFFSYTFSDCALRLTEQNLKTCLTLSCLLSLLGSHAGSLCLTNSFKALPPFDLCFKRNSFHSGSRSASVAMSCDGSLKANPGGRADEGAFKDHAAASCRYPALYGCCDDLSDRDPVHRLCPPPVQEI